MVMAQPNLGKEDGFDDLFGFSLQNCIFFLVAIGNERRNSDVPLQINM